MKLFNCIGFIYLVALIASTGGGPAYAMLPQFFSSEIAKMNPSDQVDVFRSQIFTYDIVSEGNCKKVPNGPLTQCKFPPIQIHEVSTVLPSLPFETVIRVKATRSCALASFRSLQMRLGKHRSSFENRYEQIQDQAHEGDSAMKEEQDFIRYEELKIDHTRKLVLKTDHNDPLGSLWIQPKNQEMFLGSEFLNSCQISLQIEMNRIAFDDPNEAIQFVNLAKKQLSLLSDLKEAIGTIHRSIHERKQMAGKLSGIESQLRRNQSDVQGFRALWNRVMIALPSVQQNDLMTMSASPCVSDLVESVSEFNESLSEMMDAKQATPNHILDIITDVSRSDLRETSCRLNSLLDESAIHKINQEFEKSEFQLKGMLYSLQEHYSEDRINRRWTDEFGSILNDEISGPGGTIDQLVFRLRNIGSR